MLQQALQQVTEQTFESLAFILPADEGQAFTPDDCLAADIAFSGPCNGQLRLQMPAQMLSSLAANMLGLDEEPSAAQQHDACGELLNVICGNLLPVMAGAEAIFSVLSPQVPASAPLPPGPPTSHALVCLDEGTVAISLYLV